MYVNDCDEEVNEEICPTCCGNNTHFEVALRFWKCEVCSTVWGVGMTKSYFDSLKYHETDSETK